jgi:hypothetical protein
MLIKRQIIMKVAQKDWTKRIAESAGRSLSAGTPEPDLAMFAGSVDRKLILGQRVAAEVESVRDIIGSGAASKGFHLCGKLYPAEPYGRQAELFNQSMIITTFSER